MSAALAIARREILSYLLSPIGYVVTALFLFLTSLVYFAAAPMLIGAGFSAGQPASMRLFFEIGIWVFAIVGPAISMRTISEERRMGTLEMLMTAPVTEGQVILGKFLGCLAFLVLMLLPTFAYVVVLELHGRPDYGEVLCGYLGLLLAGAAYLSSGILASTLTSSQVLAYLTTIFFWVVFLLATTVLPFLASLAEGMSGRPENSPLLEHLLGWIEAAAGFLAVGNPVSRIRGFVIGLVDSFNVVYFVTLTSVFLLAAIKSLGLRRWR